MSRRRPLPDAALSGTPDEIETQFYEAVQRGDVDRLMALWAEDDEIFCVHPGGPRLIGAAAIRASFASLFAQAPVVVRAEQVHRLHGLGGAVHHMVERITLPDPGGPRHVHILATHVFVKTALGWRLAARHASVGAEPEAETASDLQATLH